MNVVRAQYATPQGQWLRVVHGDLTHETTDAIVNAANSMLAHGGGVAGAIVRAGGAVIDRESWAWVDAHGELHTGDVAYTSAGALPCKAVLHAVGPVWDDGQHGEVEALARAMRTVLAVAATKGFASVAVPAVSSGIFGFPKRKCADVLVGETVAWCDGNAAATVCEVRFTNFDAPTVGVFVDEFVRRFGAECVVR